MDKLYIVVPCYNEEEVLPETVSRLTHKLEALISAGTVATDSRMLLVDDGSKDRTWQMIEDFHRENPLVQGLKLARNRGHQNALLAGLMTAKDHADYRLMSRRALEGLAQFKEVNLFLRGIVPMVGYKTATVEYKRGERFAGESKYPLTKMLNFALDGVTSLSVRPIRFITLLGFLLAAAGCVWALVLLILFLLGRPISGATVAVMSIWTACGLQLLATGVIGEYLGKIYLETKQRPRFIIETYLGDEGM